MADLRHLRYFLTIVEQGSLSKAAETLRVAQPALSTHVKKLEHEFGCRLLHRTQRGIVPTESGLRLKKQAKILLEMADGLSDDVRGVEAVPSGPAVIGIPTSLGTTLSVPLIKRVRQSFPAVRLRVMEALSGHMARWVLSGDADMALVFGAELPTGLSSTFLAREDLCLVAPKDAPETAGLPRVSMDRVLDLPLILPGRPHGVREEVERAAAIRRRRPDVVVELDALDQIKALVADGIGFTVLSRRYATQGPLAGSLTVVPVEKPAIWRTISLAHSSERPLSAAAQAVHKAVLDLVAGLTTDGRWTAG